MLMRNIQDEILKLKKEKDFCILAHSYMTPDILEIADYTGDSFKLSVDASKVANKNILVCGVRFMAETAKILSPDKNVYLSNPSAGCPMAEQITPEEVLKWKDENEGYAVVAYVNTTAQLKAVSDVCVTSSSAVEIVSQMDEDNIIFLPDRNLGAYVTEKVSDKNIKCFSGCCPVHASVTEEEVLKVKSEHPDALVLIHPECEPNVLKHADYIGSTSGIINYVINSEKNEFIIGTELSIVQYLQLKCPEKKFYLMSQKLICSNMKMTSLMDVLNVLKCDGGEKIELDADLLDRAYSPIKRMIELG